MSDRNYFVYIITNKWRTVLYTGVTNDVLRRSGEHRDKRHPRSFTARYNCRHLVYYEIYGSPMEAILREKQIKAGSRRKKISLIESRNPDWQDLLPGLLQGEE